MCDLHDGWVTHRDGCRHRGRAGLLPPPATIRLAPPRRQDGARGPAACAVSSPSARVRAR